MVADVKFSAGCAASDPEERSVIIVGQVENLRKVGFEAVKPKLAPRVTEEIWRSAVDSLSPTPTDTVNLYLNAANVCALPTRCSRHNAPSRAHAITKMVKSCSSGKSENIVVVCDRSDVFASGCAVARAFPLFSRKTPGGGSCSKMAVEEAAASSRGSSKATKANAEVNVEFLNPSGEAVADEKDVSALQDAAYGIRLAARIVDTPCNEMHTDGFLDCVRDVADQLGIKPVIIQGEELNRRGFGGIYGVGKAALHPPALAVLSHEPEGATQTVAWVGKGIVYDTGGLSIKGKTAMPGMKRDCGGAAGILGAFYTAVKQGFTQNLHAVLCLAENAVSNVATRPDDIHTLYSGRTVEINNTDAEGRLVLSDGVAYANKDLGADIVVDMCTLTGAQGIATGRYHAAHMTNREEWESRTLRAGRASADLSFPIVYCPELHFPEFSSAVADMKNSVADRSNAQSSCAGLFIHANLGFDFPGVWLHIDMASPVHSGERATGYGVALLNTLFGNFSKSALLNEVAPSADSSNGASNDVDMTEPEESPSGRGSRSKKMRKH